MAGLLEGIDQRTQLAGHNRFELLLFKLAGSQRFGINVFKVTGSYSMPGFNSNTTSAFSRLRRCSFKRQNYPDPGFGYGDRIA